MYLRVYRAKNKNETTREYLQIVETRRLTEKKYPQQRLLLNIARIDRMDKKTRSSLFNLASGILKVLGDEIPEFPEIKKTGEKWYWGLIGLCSKIWEKLGLSGLCLQISRKRDIQYLLGRVLFAIVVGRFYRKLSEFSVFRWSRKVYHGFSLKDIRLHHFYRALDLLDENWLMFEDLLRWRVLDLFNQSAQVIFIDTTSIIYWGEGDENLTVRGYSKQRRGDRKQIIIGVVMVQGLPVGIEIEPGNTADIYTMRRILKCLRKRFNFKEVCIVCDAGMVSLDDIGNYRRRGRKYLVRAMSNEKTVREKVREARENSGRWEQVGKELWAQEFRAEINGGEQERLIVVRNEDEEIRDREVRKHILEKLKSKEGRDVKELVKNKGYNRYLASGRKIKIDQKKVELSFLRDGIWVVRSNREFKDLKEAVDRYRELWVVERIFREIKQLWEVESVYHRRGARIKGHIYACFLTLLLGFIIQREVRDIGIKLPYEEVLEEFKELKVEWIKIGDKKFLVRDELNKWQKKLFKRIKVKIPPNVSESQ